MALEYSQKGKGKYYLTFTYGCQMNVRDSETIAGLLEAMGYSATDDLDKADLVLFNTCSVRHSAENKVFGKLGEITALKRKRPDLIIALGGCMAQVPENRIRLKKQGVDIVFGTHNIHELPQIINEVLMKKSRIINVWDNAGPIVESLPAKRSPGVNAFVNIMFGCDNFCSYCIVPYTRGRERSRRPADIVQEITELARLGYPEITLLGQNVNSYGKGLDENIDFADLLGMVSEIDGIKRIRFTTSHPKDMSDRLIDAMAKYDKVCEHAHIALQSGSNNVLKRMNRGYTQEHFVNLVNKMRDRIPEIAITTDIIVGFPGETEKDYMETLKTVDKIRFDAAFTFMYSPRAGTRAASFTDEVPLEIKKERLIRLNTLQYGIAMDINKSLEGTVQEVLVEGPSKTDPQKMSSRTRTNRIIIFSGNEGLIGKIINVKITEAKTFSLFGEIV